MPITGPKPLLRLANAAFGALRQDEPQAPRQVLASIKENQKLLRSDSHRDAVAEIEYRQEKVFNATLGTITQALLWLEERGLADRADESAAPENSLWCLPDVEREDLAYLSEVLEEEIHPKRAPGHRLCRYCGASFVPKQRNHRHCSTVCRAAYASMRRALKTSTARESREEKYWDDDTAHSRCQHCGEVLPPGNSGREYCSSRCRQAAYRARVKVAG